MLVLLLLTPAFTGCLTPDDPVTPTSTPSPSDDPNPWQRGLASTYPTPDHVENRSAEERRANLAPPGDPEFAAFDHLVKRWMDVHDIPTATLAIMKDGQLRYENGYGHVDRDATQPANASTMMRIASISKPMTGRVIALLVEEGRIAWDDPVFCVPPGPKADCILPLDPHPDRPVVDDRIAEVTVGHLRNHTAGFATDGPCNDAIWSSGAVEAAGTLGVPSPAPAWRLAQWLMGAELAHDPGETYEYCNAGYITLGVVAEAVTGATFEAVMEAYLFRPLEVTGGIELGGTLPDDRDPREPFYVCDEGTTQSVFDPNETVCWPDGGFSVELFSGAGGVVSTAEAVVAVMETVPLEFSGVTNLTGYLGSYSYSGSMPGTRASWGTIQGMDTGAAQFAFIFNTRTPWEGCDSPLGYLLYATDVPGCNVADLREALFELVRTWSAADESAGR